MRIFFSTDDNVGEVTRDNHPPNEVPLDIEGWNASRLAVIDSTNDELVRRHTAGGVVDRTVLVADVQTAGRGRLDRRWEAPAGLNLLFSLFFASPIASPQRLQHTVALAVVEAVNELGVEHATLKWPNDVIVNTKTNDGHKSASRKLAGMLSTMTSDGSVIVGTGCNVNWAPAGACSVSEHTGTEHEPTEVLQRILEAFDRLFGLAPESIDQRYRASIDTVGRRVKVELPGGEHLVGRAVQVNADGALEVIDECAVTHRFHAADVVHLRPED